MKANEIESIYWVFTLKCNDFCDHCYNNSGPNGESILIEELLKVIPNLPDRVGRIILSGGEPLFEMKKLLLIVNALRARYKNDTKIYLQTNGDLLNEKNLKNLEDADIDRIDVVSVDNFHRLKGSHVPELCDLFMKFGWKELQDNFTDARDKFEKKTFKFWGADENFWIGGLWARGRALLNDYGNRDATKNFCAQWSGALGFLNIGSPEQEVHIQLYRLYPCCPTTLYSLGDVREKSILELLLESKTVNAFQTLNNGDINSLGTKDGLSKEYIKSRIESLGDVCLWCDEYFEKHFTGERGEKRR